MFKNILKIFLRKTSKQSGFFSFQLIGLVTGISVFLIVFSFYQFETSFDTQYSDSERVYRVERIDKREDRIRHTTTNSKLLPELAVSEIPEVEAAVGVISARHYRNNIQYPADKPWSGLKRHRVTKNFFEIFDFEILEGNIETVLDDPTSMVITQSMAHKLFGEEQAVGKTVFLDRQPMLVSGVIADVPENLHMQFDFLTSMDRLYNTPRWDADRLATEWNYASFVLSYLKLSENADPEEVAEKIHSIYSRFRTEDDPDRSFILTPVNDIHLYSHTDWELMDNGNPTFVRLVFFAGLITLLLTFINFVKMSLANTTLRIRETGIRKVLGGSKHSLALSIICEHGLVLLLAILLSFGLVYSLGAGEVSWLPLTLYRDFLTSPMTLSVLAVLLVLGTVIPSIIPISMLTRLSTMKALKGTVTSSGHNFGVLRILMSVQVLFSLVLITLTFFFKDQIDYILTRETGFDKEGILFMERYIQDGQTPSVDTFKDELLTISGINAVTTSAQIPLRWAAGENYELIPVGEENGVMMSRGWIGYDYFKTLGAEIIKGRDFSKDIPADSTRIVINEAAVRSLGVEDPIGKKFQINFGGGLAERTIVGVVKDFNFRSMHSPLLPAYFMCTPRGPVITVNFAPNSDIESLLSSIERAYVKYSPEEAFNYTFMGDYFAAQHDEDINLKNAISFLSVVIIFLASLGIFGMSAFIGQRKEKEVAIRKVLGSTGSSVFWLLSRNYVITVLAALFIAIYPVYLLVNQWFDNFAYTTHINYFNFGLGLLIVLGTVILVSGINTLKVAVKNPVDTLNHE